MELEPTPIPGAFAIRGRTVEDARGTFTKVLHLPSLEAQGARFATAESFYTTSQRGVIRGMHCQLPPAEHAKLVYCVRGRVLDVLLDLRRGSPAQGRSHAAELSERNRLMFLIPAGVAHGFLALEDDSTVVYSVTTPHAPALDGGVRWDSFGFTWPVAEPVLSPRDRALPPLGEFQSPFTFRS